MRVGRRVRSMVLSSRTTDACCWKSTTTLTTTSHRCKRHGAAMQIKDVPATTNREESHPGHLDRWRLFNAWVTMYVVGADLFIMSPLLPGMANDLSVNVERAGWLVSVF